jgi:hypothetical protein
MFRDSPYRYYDSTESYESLQARKAQFNRLMDEALARERERGYSFFDDYEVSDDDSDCDEDTLLLHKKRRENLVFDKSRFSSDSVVNTVIEAEEMINLVCEQHDVFDICEVQPDESDRFPQIYDLPFHEVSDLHKLYTQHSLVGGMNDVPKPKSQPKKDRAVKAKSLPRARKLQRSTSVGLQKKRRPVIRRTKSVGRLRVRTKLNKTREFFWLKFAHVRGSTSPTHASATACLSNATKFDKCADASSVSLMKRKQKDYRSYIPIFAGVTWSVANLDDIPIKVAVCFSTSKPKVSSAAEINQLVKSSLNRGFFTLSSASDKLKSVKKFQCNVPIARIYGDRSYLSNPAYVGSISSAPLQQSYVTFVVLPAGKGTLDKSIQSQVTIGIKFSLFNRITNAVPVKAKIKKKPKKIEKKSPVSPEHHAEMQANLAEDKQNGRVLKRKANNKKRNKKVKNVTDAVYGPKKKKVLTENQIRRRQVRNLARSKKRGAIASPKDPV